MTLFSQSMASCPRLKSVRTRPRTTKKVPPTNGSTARTASASRQLIEISRMLAPRIRNTDEMSDAIVCATNILTASTSDVRWVSSAEGVTCWM